jgi:hypothetical protein
VLQALLQLRQFRFHCGPLCRSPIGAQRAD